MPKVDSYAAATALQNDEMFFIKQTSTKKATSAQVRTLPIYATYAALPSTGVVDGQEALVNRLVGAGYFRVRYDLANARWNVAMGEVIASANDPHSVVTAGAVTPVDVTWFTLPADMIGDGQEWEFAFPYEAANGNTGNDSTVIFLTAATLASQTAAGNTIVPNIQRYSRNGTNLRPILRLGATVNTSIANFSNNVGIEKDVIIRITPATIGNSSYVRRGCIRRIS
jgi:hypothetical protein